MPAATAGGSVVLVESAFDTDAEGWRLTGDPVSPTPAWIAEGGIDGGSYVQITDAAQGPVIWMYAPDKFFGDFSAAYDGLLEFGLRARGARGFFGNDDLRLDGAGLSLRHNLMPFPRDEEWTQYRVPLTAEIDWRVGRHDGPRATEAQFRAVLADITSLGIRGEWISGPDSTDLDNVRLRTPVTRLPGDFDASGQVEQGDLNLVLKHWGQTRPLWFNAGAFGSYAVDQEELNRVLEWWGRTSIEDPPGSDPRGSAVPEPLSAVGLAGLALLKPTRRRSRQ
ncbi:MAG: laminin B domain-containing protein [Planctomycetota bacterium]